MVGARTNRESCATVAKNTFNGILGSPVHAFNLHLMERLQI